MNNDDKIFHFTVGQLVEILNSLPQDLPVLTSGYETGFENICPPKVVELKREEKNKYYEGEFQDTEEGDKNSFQGVILQRVVRND